MALLEGTLGEAAKAGLLRHLEGCPVCRAEHDWLAAMGADLEAMGDAVVEKAPQMDLVEAVMAEVAGLGERPAVPSSKVVRFEPRADARRGRPWAWLGVAAAAAAAVLVFWAAGSRITNAPDTLPAPEVARDTAPGDAVETPEGLMPQPRIETAGPVETDPAGPAKDASDDLDRHRWAETPPPETVSTELAALTVEDVLAARREAVTDPEARARLAQWASLTVEKARELVASEDTSLDAKVGAAQVLPPEEAGPVLLAAVAVTPQDPYKRYELADSYGARDDPTSAAAAAAQWSSLAEEEEDNALLHYQLAAALFDQGDLEGAVAALAEADELESAMAYTGAASRHRVEALVASGVDPELAAVLTALTAGADQYADLVALGRRLLDHGQDQEELGEAALAQDIYESVYDMGAQLAAGASYSAEELAGLDLQQAAIDVLSGLFEFLQFPESIDVLTGQTNELVGAFEAVGQFFEELDTFFTQQIEQSFVGRIAEVILSQGDLNLFDVLFGGEGSLGSGLPAAATE